MTLPTSRPISLGQVCTEFGAPSNTALGAFVRGGAWVPNTPANSGVPTSKPISLGDLLGASAVSASVSPTSVSGSGLANTTVTSGSCTCTVTGITSPTYLWARVSGDTTISPVNSGSATTAFRAAMGPGTTTKTAVFNCVVSGTGGPATSNNVTVTLDASP